MKFQLLSQDHQSRLGRIEFSNGSIQTPTFMPVGTYGVVKGLTPDELVTLGAEIILANTFHLFLRPGLDLIQHHGGLHQFNRWSRPILTDSGGFQVFSLAKRRTIHKHGVWFQSPIDGAKVFLGPEQAIAAQIAFGSNIAMIFDECTPYPVCHQQAEQSMAAFFALGGAVSALLATK